MMRFDIKPLVALLLLFPACGGGAKPAEAPTEATPASAASDEAPTSDDAGAEKSEPTASAPAAEAAPAASDDMKVTRTPKDILTAPDVIFMFSFTASDVKEVADKKCDEQSKGDPKKRADCMTREKQKIVADGVRFKQEKERWYWMTIRRRGNKLVNLHKVPIEFGKETQTSIVLKPAGKDEGTAAGKALGETTIEVPNDYQIVFQDPQLGKMVYEAKIGITGE